MWGLSVLCTAFARAPTAALPQTRRAAAAAMSAVDLEKRFKRAEFWEARDASETPPTLLTTKQLAAHSTPLRHRRSALAHMS